MHRAKSIVNISLIGLRKWRGNLRIILLITYLFVYMLSEYTPVLRFSFDVGYGIRPYLFPLFSSGLFYQTVIMMGAVALFADAPFLDESSPYVILRSGRFTWGLGQILYVFLASTIYVLFIFLLNILFILPHIEFGETWGKVITTLARTNAGSSYGIFWLMDSRILNNLTPLAANGLSLLLTWMCTIFVGLLMYLLNLKVHRALGPSVCCGMIGMNYFIYNFLSDYAYYWSPITMSNLAMIYDPSTGFVSVRYAVLFFTAAIIILSVISAVSIHKKTIEVIETD